MAQVWEGRPSPAAPWNICLISHVLLSPLDVDEPGPRSVCLHLQKHGGQLPVCLPLREPAGGGWQDL